MVCVTAAAIGPGAAPATGDESVQLAQSGPTEKRREVEKKREEKVAKLRAALMVCVMAAAIVKLSAWRRSSGQLEKMSR